MFFKEYATSENGVVARQEIDQTDAHIVNLVDLSDEVRSANVLGRHVCRNVRTNAATNLSVMLVGRVRYGLACRLLSAFALFVTLHSRGKSPLVQYL